MKLKMIKNTIIKHFIDEIDEKFEEYAYMFGSKKVPGNKFFLNDQKNDYLVSKNFIFFICRS